MAFGKLTLRHLLNDLGGPKSGHGSLGLTTLALSFLLVTLLMTAAGLIVDGYST